MTDKSCENDCTLPLRFPRRPGTQPPAEHGDGCPCCSASSAGTSQDNRPSLSHFNYRIGTYGSIREFLFQRINSTPELQNWTHRAPDDPAVALLEGASILGDILTFYQETYANEAFLRTAEWRESISDLVRLLGYRLSPSVGGNAVFAFEIKKDEPAVIPAGFPVKATLEELPKPADFETKEEITAYPWLSRFNLFRPLIQEDITAQTTEFYITAPEQLTHPIEINAGDRLIIGKSDKTGLVQPLKLGDAEIVLVESIRELHGTKIIKIKGKMKRDADISSLAAYKLGRTFHHFGHNSPDEIVDESKPVTSTAEVTSTSTTTSSTIPHLKVPKYRPATETLISKAVDMRFGPLEFPLDSEVNDLPNNVPMIIQAGYVYQRFMPANWYRPPHKTIVRTITDQKSITVKWGGISGTVTQVNLQKLFTQSIGAGDDEFIKKAIKEAADADILANNAFTDLNTAKSVARAAKISHANAKKAHDLAVADHADKSAKALAAAAEAATLAVAQQTAAAALKDDATDAAAQAAVAAAITALNAAYDAKTDADETARNAGISSDRARETKDAADASAVAAGLLTGYLTVPLSPGLVHAPDLVLMGFVGGVDIAVALDVRSTDAAKTAANTAKLDAEAAALLADTAAKKSELAKTAAEAAKAAAAANADATRRYDDAKLAAGTAMTAAGTAATTAETAKNAKLSAYDGVDTAALALANADEKVLAMAAVHEDALKVADARHQAKLIRMYIGDALFHEVVSPLFRLKRAKKETTALKGDSLNFYGTADQVKNLKGRRVMLEKPGSEPQLLTVTQVPDVFDAETVDYPVLRPITISERVKYADFPNENPTVTVFGNLVDANEGKSMPEVPIGSGNELLIFQNFKIPKAPLTYYIVPENTPSETPELEIYVDGRLWTQVDSFFGRGKDEQIYIVREDAGGNSWAQFGDGKAGARLTTGINNVTALYRMGTGAFGPLKADTKVQASAKLKNLDKIGMPMDASGGAPREDGESARNAAPGKVQSLGRIVSLKDFEAETAAIPGVASASAAWQLVDNIPAVVMTVLMETGRSTEIEARRDTISAYNIQRGAARHSVDVILGKRLYTTVSVQYALKATYRADVVEPLIRLALGVTFGKATRDEDQTGLFSLRRRGFGVREYASTIEGTVQNVEGVLWAKTVAFKELGPPADPDDLAKFNEDDPETYVLPSPSVLLPIISCDGGHILSLFDSHLALAVVAEGGS